MAPSVHDDTFPAAAELSAADVVASTLAAVDELELSAALRAGLRVFSPGFMTRDVTELIPSSWLPTLRRPNGHRPRTFPELVSAVRHQSRELAPTSSTGDDGTGTNPRAGG